ncbi:chemotaxis protein CheX [Rhodopirellula sp. JC740]|uniref:histidine kinase n=1 Tax=Rhodopirellula halodulae TaxID=2894198 RepID=A0ABS8NEK8_9BACT|nr:ATP-binding protein [Rhodopirellula sp. JC740]MCC9641984.1 chemotaxis protein CheX [Rhodopirellula sp. JC740]
MDNVTRYTDAFASIASRTCSEMFGIQPPAVSKVETTNSVQTEKSFILSIYYTGTVYGEYMLAMDESTAAAVIGMDPTITDENREEIREDICDAMSETLNTIVGEAIVGLQESYAKLTITAPRIYFGQIRYPKFRTGKCVLNTEFGEIECHFCLDLMRLDLAASYSEAMDSLVAVNAKLKDANRHLAEQQAQLVHSAKMASVGVLASGVAHEINNPLFFVDANLTTLNDYIQVIESTIGLYETLCESLVSADVDTPEELSKLQSNAEEQELAFVIEDTKSLVEETRDGVARIKSIVKGLKDFSQVDRNGKSEASVNEIVQNTCKLIAAQLPKDCEVEMNLSELPTVQCNTAEVGQAIAGVLLNSGQASRNGGSITLRTDVIDSNITIVVEDNGIGIDASDIEHVFEPFFTTKAVGEGTGLGLSIAYGIFEKHNGSISIESEAGVGTKVTMRLPCVRQPAAT